MNRFRLKPVVPLETDIQAEVLQALRLRFPTGWWERCNTGGTRLKGRFVRFGLGNGTADIIGCLRGRMVAVECKRPGEDLRPDQAAWRARHVAAGGIYVVATSWQKAVEEVNRACEVAA